MAVSFNGSTGYLTLGSAVRAALPMSVVLWTSRAGATGGNQWWVSQSKASTTDYAGIFIDDTAANKNGFIHSGSDSGQAVRSAAPNPGSGSLQLAMFVVGSTTSVNVYYGNNTVATDTTPFTNTTSTYDTTTIGGIIRSGTGIEAYTKGDIAEVHFYNTALTSSDWTTLAAGSTLPETLTGWVDGWTLLNATSLTSIGGARTLTLNGGVTTSALTHPYTRGGGGGGSFGRPYYNRLLGGGINL